MENHKTNEQIEKENRFYNLRKVADAAKKAYPELTANEAIKRYNGVKDPKNCRTFRQATKEGFTREQLDKCPRFDIFGFNDENYTRENPTAPRLYALSCWDVTALLEESKPAKKNSRKKTAKPADAPAASASTDDLPF